jgi:hypothetical protein
MQQSGASSMKSGFVLVAFLVGLAGCSTAPRFSDAPVVSQFTAEQEASLYSLHHQIIPNLLFNSDGLFFVSLLNHDIDRLREAIAGIAGPAYAEGVSLKVSDDQRIVFISFPRPSSVPLCHHVALARIPGGFRYLTLEHTDDPFSQGQVSFLCEWTPQPTHMNYGPRKYSSLQKFEKDVAEFLGDPSRQLPEAVTEFE